MLKRPLMTRTSEERRELVEKIQNEVKNGSNIQQACNKYSVKRSTYASWLGGPLHRQEKFKSPKKVQKPISLQTLVVEPVKSIKALYLKGSMDEILSFFERA